MIIELFGPPGVGKTTFARTLAARLGANGVAIELMLSHRPAEQGAPLDPRASSRAAAAVQRIRRPLVEMLALVRRPSAISGDVNTAINLVRMMPPTSIMWSIRLSQYLSRLSRSWQQASQSHHVVLFDQAFVQAVSSLMLLGRAQDERLVSDVLDCAPKSDLLIRLDAPREVLEARLRDRERSQSTLERLFELDLKSNLELIRIIERLHALIEKRGETVLRINSVDRPSLELAAAQIEERLAAKHRAELAAEAAS